MMSIVLGVAAILLSNAFLLFISYMVKVHPLDPGEILICRSIIQMVTFGLLSLYHHYKDKRRRYQDLDQSTAGFDKFSWFLVMVCNFATSIMSLLCYQAVKMLPLGDFIVFCFTAPLFTLIISVILRRYV